MSDKLVKVVNSYAQANGKSVEDIKNTLEKFADTFVNAHTSNEKVSIFSLDENTKMSQDDFGNLLKNASSDNSNFSSDDISLFMDIMDSDNNGYLSYEELQLLANSEGDISAYSLWASIIGIKEVKEGIGTGAAGDTGGTGATGGTGGTDGTGGTGAAGGTGGTDGTDGADGTGGTDGTGGADAAGGNNPTTYSELATLIDSILAEGGAFTTPEEVIDALEESGRITKELADEARSKYAEYSDIDEATIRQYMSLYNISRDEAIEKMKEDGKIQSPVYGSTTKDENDLNQMAIDNICSDLSNYLDFWFGNGTEAVKIFQDDSLTPNDWVNILASFKETNGKNLIRAIDDYYVGDAELKEKYTDILVDNLLEAAKNGNEKAYQVLADCMYDGMKGAGTFDPFYQSFFEKIDNETLYKVIQHFDGGVSKMKDMIKADFSGNTEKNYIDKINQAVNANGRS